MLRFIYLLCSYAHVLATYSDGLGKAACEKSLRKVKEPSALPLLIVVICGRAKHSDIFRSQIGSFN